MKFNSKENGNADKDERFYIGTEDDGTKVYWYPYYCMTEYHRSDGSVDIKMHK